MIYEQFDQDNKERKINWMNESINDVAYVSKRIEEILYSEHKS